MRFSGIFIAASVSSTLALSIPTERRADEQLFTIETAPGETQEVTEAQKWELFNKGVRFMDITDYAELHSFAQERASIQAVDEVQAAAFPSDVMQKAKITPLLPKLNQTNLKTNLEKFTTFHNRYYKSSYGKESSEWLLTLVQSVISASGTKGVSAKAFTHTSWTQNSIIATIPGKSANTIVIGAHQDSVNGASPSTGRSPGADDNGSGSMTILEAMRVLLTDPEVASGQAPNTIEFHWYAAEEGGLLGSQAIFTNYKNNKKAVKAMLNQDMTGYVKPGVKESMGVIIDYVDTGLTNFIKKVVTAYCAIPYVESECGYACSDHASASKAGYPSAFVFESAMENSNPDIHTARDTTSTVSYNHMIEHAKLTVGLAVELGYASGL